MQFYGLSVHSDKVLLVTEFCESGNLRDFIRSNAVGEEQLRRIFLGIAQGTFMHCLDLSARAFLPTKYKVVHRNLAARNVMLKQNFDVKLADYGFPQNGFNQTTQM